MVTEIKFITCIHYTLYSIAVRGSGNHNRKNSVANASHTYYFYEYDQCYATTGIPVVSCNSCSVVRKQERYYHSTMSYST